MRNRLVITIALGVLLAVMTAGVVGAQGLGGGNGVSVDVPGGGSAGTGQVLPACANGTDDDGDGIVDLADPGCAGNPLDGDETDAAPAPEPPVVGEVIPDEEGDAPEEPAEENDPAADDDPGTRTAAASSRSPTRRTPSATRATTGQGQRQGQGQEGRQGLRRR